MDVTRENFAELYPQIRDAIANASFIAIDEEMTGIMDRFFCVDFDYFQTYIIYFITC